jgi:hypothetical protein
VLVTGGFRVTSSGATRLDVSDHCSAYADLEV